MKDKSDERFIRIYKQSKISHNTEIWVDRMTGVQYLYHGTGYGGGICPLLDEHGKPVITDPSALRDYE